MIRAIHDCVTRHIYPIQNPSTAERMAVCAVGGYGRGTLAPGSDGTLPFAALRSMYVRPGNADTAEALQRRINTLIDIKARRAKGRKRLAV